MSDIKIIGKCKFCKRKGEVIERITSNKGKQKVIQVCRKCEERESKEILKTVKQRELDDDGTRFSHAQVMQILKEDREKKIKKLYE